MTGKCQSQRRKAPMHTMRAEDLKMEEDLAVKMPQLSVEMMKFVNCLSIDMDWHHGFGAECYAAMKGEKVMAVDVSRERLIVRDQSDFAGTSPRTHLGLGYGSV
jgi:hypothetical protein